MRGPARRTFQPLIPARNNALWLFRLGDLAGLTPHQVERDLVRLQEGMHFTPFSILFIKPKHFRGDLLDLVRHFTPCSFIQIPFEIPPGTFAQVIKGAVVDPQVFL